MGITHIKIVCRFIHQAEPPLALCICDTYNACVRSCLIRLQCWPLTFILVGKDHPRLFPLRFQLKSLVQCKRLTTLPWGHVSSYPPQPSVTCCSQPLSGPGLPFPFEVLPFIPWLPSGCCCWMPSSTAFKTPCCWGPSSFHLSTRAPPLKTHQVFTASLHKHLLKRHEREQVWSLPRSSVWWRTWISI